MPKISRQVEQEVGVEELNAELVQFVGTAMQDGVYIRSDVPNERGERVKAGDILVPVDTLYQQGVLAKDTQILAVKTLDEAGILWGAYFGTDGQKRLQFFTGDAIQAIVKTSGPKPKAEPPGKAKRNSRR